MKDVVTIKDSVNITLYQTDLTITKVGEFVDTPKRSVMRSGGLQWWVRTYPAGDGACVKDYVSVFLFVNKPVQAKFTFAVDGSSITHTTTFEFTGSSRGRGRTYASHESLRPLFRDGTLTITCSVEFDVEVPYTSFIPRNFQLFDHIPTDMEFVVGSERMPFHKNFISMISPVFYAIFSYDTTESKSGQVEITDFDCETVKAAVDLCYGRELKDPSIETIVSILRFADKYFITAVTNEFERLLLLNLSTKNFGLIVRYADDCSKKTLLTACYKFYKDHLNDITGMKQFAELPPALVADMLKSAFNLKTNFDVLRYAHKNGIDSVIDHLEQPLLTHITLQNFCTVVDYAWECSRDGLKKVCAQFFNENTLDIMNLKDFHLLAAGRMQELVKAGYDIKHGAQ